MLFGFLALIAVDFVFLLPLLGGLALFTFLAGFAMLGLCVAGMVDDVLEAVPLGSRLHPALPDAHLRRDRGLLGVGVGGGALLLLMIDYVVFACSVKFARLHYELLNKAEMGGAHG